MTDRLLTPSKITAWLDCAHYLSLQHRVEDGAQAAPGSTFGSFARLLVDKGLQHEADCLADYERRGKKILVVPDREKHERFADWVARVGNPLGDGWDVIYQMPFVHDGVRGIADFLERVVSGDGSVTYEPVDAKLARVEAKPGHVLQLCFYADAIEALTGRRPKQMHIWLGSGRRESLTISEFGPYWRRIRAQLADVLDPDRAVAPSAPVPCDHCAFCEFFDVCEQQWRGEDSLIYVAGIRSADLQLLDIAGVSRLAELAEVQAGIDGMGPDRLLRLVGQATLQVAARIHNTEKPPFEMIEPGEDPLWGRGHEQLPRPDDGDLFLDFEGHPFWRADRGLFFLFGLILRADDGTWRYKDWWAHDESTEAEATADLIDFLASRRLDYPDMHVYHYNHTERSSLERLAIDYNVREASLADLVETGLFVDLLAVSRNAMQVGTESYGLKHLERLTEFERGHDIDQGAGAVVSYETYMATGDVAELAAIASYNEDDVRATMALRDWLVDNRPAETPWRAATFVPEEGTPELDEQVARLHEFEEDSPEYLLGDVLGYWRREWLACLAPKLALCQADVSTVLESPEALAQLTAAGLVDRFGKKGNVLAIPAMRFTMPDQAMESFHADGDQVVYLGADGVPAYASIDRLDTEAGVLDLMWGEKQVERGTPPTVVVRNDWVQPKPKPEALSELAGQILDSDGHPPNPVSLALLRRDLPAFVSGRGPAGGVFSDNVAEMTAWAPHLDNSFVAIQGPPGTGKTYRAAHLVRALILAGKRVGITAMSHHAIDNVLDEVVAVLAKAGDLDRLNAVRRVSQPSITGHSSVTYVTNNKACAKAEFNVVAGTTWLFAGDDMKDSPVDVLLIDEAGQLALADALAASRSARNLVLLGDPLQLAQVSQAAHPGGGGLSVLQHVLGSDVTMPDDRGVFLTETRRMHPDVCSFISQEIYQGRLSSHQSCAQQTTVEGTGLRWIEARHEGRTTRCPEEAEIVAAEIAGLMGSAWTDQHGNERPLGPSDFMVVAPYNDQVQWIRECLDQDDRTRDVPVGTVDKFQGRQAAVVFFTMTTSSGSDITRGADFLFSRNRLNVAISRARCLAYLVCTEDLLNTRARNVPEMRLISTLCAFVETARLRAL